MRIRPTSKQINSTFTKMWNIIREACPNAQPHYFFADFEQAAITYSFHINLAINSSETLLFHLSQSVYRKLQSLVLQSEYHTEPEFALTMRMLPSLAFVPSELVEWSF